MVRRHTQPPLPPSPSSPHPPVAYSWFQLIRAKNMIFVKWDGFCLLFVLNCFLFLWKKNKPGLTFEETTDPDCLHLQGGFAEGKAHEAAMWLQTGQGAGWACSLFLVDKTQELVLMSPEWILKDNLHGAGWGWNCCFGCLLTPAVLPLCYLLALDCLAIPWPHLCKSLSSLALLMSPTDGL